ncbi:hypothetical protein GQ53DRAFT_646571 [Thozetella sp. PMI_491]|nr:hypothetical protein GQ53DRAFT_646571 [Thozetella sp. PMI_491]
MGELYPEVIPGPGLPSLAELNLTSAELYNTKPDLFPLLPRAAGFDRKCGPEDRAYTNVQDIIACFNYLKNLGGVNCGVGQYAVTEMCRAGQAHVTGESISGRSESASCTNVATAVLSVINGCTRPDQSCAGKPTLPLNYTQNAKTNFCRIRCCIW